MTIDEENILLNLQRPEDGENHGEMLRLAHLLELLTPEELIHRRTLWSYLRHQKFKKTFVETYAKRYWSSACKIINSMPFRSYMLGGCTEPITPYYQLCSALLKAATEKLLERIRHEHSSPP